MNGRESVRRVALLTGAGGGVGRSVAARLARDGYDLLLTDLNADDLADTTKTVAAETPEATLVEVVGDLCAEGFVEELVGKVRTAFGRLDGLVNNAGIIAGAPVEQATVADWDRLMNVNAKSHFLLIQAALPLLRESKGAIVNNSSIAGLVGFPSMPLYCASKAAAVGLTRALAVDLVDDGIRVNAVCPGTIDTPMPRAFINDVPEAQRAKAEKDVVARHLIKRLAEPREAADVIAFLLSEQASFLTGLALPLDGGWTAW